LNGLSASHVKPSTLFTEQHLPFLRSLAMVPLGCIETLPECVPQISVRLSSCSSLLVQAFSFNKEFVPLVRAAVLCVTESLLSSYAEWASSDFSIQLVFFQTCKVHYFLWHWLQHHDGYTYV
jgi:hypothetical protein